MLALDRAQWRKNNSCSQPQLIGIKALLGLVWLGLVWFGLAGGDTLCPTNSHSFERVSVNFSMWKVGCAREKQEGKPSGAW